MALLAYYRIRKYRPGRRLTKVTDYAYSVDGALSIGFKNGELVDQSSISQGVGAAHFTLKDKASTNTHTVDIGLEDKINASSKRDVGINFCYNSTKLGSLNGYTFKDFSILDSLKILKEFGEDQNNESNLLYEYVHAINKYIKVITGAASLGSLLEGSKGVSLASIASFFSSAQFDNSYDSIEDNYISSPELYYPSSDTLRITLNPQSEDAWTLIIDFSDEILNSGYSFGIGIENIKIAGYYGNFSINLFEADQNGDDNITSSELSRLKINGFKTANPSTDPYVDLEYLPILVKMGIKTTNTHEYSLSGTLDFPGVAALLGLKDFSIKVHLSVLEEKDEKNVHMVDGYIELLKSGSEINNSWITSHEYYRVEIFLRKKDVYVKKTVIKNSVLSSNYNVTIDYWRTTSELFTSDLVYYLVVYILGVGEGLYNTIYGMIKDREDTYLDYIQGLTHDNANSKRTLNYRIVTGISGYLDITYNKNDDYSISKVYLDFKATDLLHVTVDASMDQSLANHSSTMTYVDNFINAFNSSSYTKNLGNRVDHNDTSNVYVYSTSGSSYKTGNLTYNGETY